MIVGPKCKSCGKSWYLALINHEAEWLRWKDGELCCLDCYRMYLAASLPPYTGEPTFSRNLEA